MDAPVRESAFWVLMDDEFGPAYARVLARTQSFTDLDGRTVLDALADGVPPRRVWAGVCEQMGVPPDRRLGRVGPDRP